MDHQSVKTIKTRFVQDSFEFEKMERKEVFQALKDINPYKATGYDNLPPRVLKLAADELATSLTKIFNQVIQTKEWPTDWKKGEWSPIYKKEDHCDVANYRPVTILNAVDKSFEQLLCRQLANNFEPIFDPFMSAYRKQYSCETTLIRLVS
jgi:hypothetical protein